MLSSNLSLPSAFSPQYFPTTTRSQETSLRRLRPQHVYAAIILHLSENKSGMVVWTLPGQNFSHRDVYPLYKITARHCPGGGSGCRFRAFPGHCPTENNALKLAAFNLPRHSGSQSRWPSGVSSFLFLLPLAAWCLECATATGYKPHLAHCFH